MKNSILSISFLVFSLPVLLFSAPEDYNKIVKKAKEGKAEHAELLEAQKKCYKEYIVFFRKKYASCASAQEKRNQFLNLFAKQDKALAPAIAKFNSGLIRNALDRKIFSDVYKKFASNKDFMKLDKTLWEEKTKAAFSSVTAQLADGKKDMEKAYQEIMQELTEGLEKCLLKEFTANFVSSKEKGSALYQATLEEIRKYKKAADPKEMAKARRNITLFCKGLFRKALEQGEELKKVMKEAEKVNRERIKRELELELKNQAAAYARYTASFGLKLSHSGKSMQEIVLNDPIYKKWMKELDSLNKKRQKLSAELMKNLSLPEVKELSSAIKEVRSAGKK